MRNIQRLNIWVIRVLEGEKGLEVETEYAFKEMAENSPNLAKDKPTDSSSENRLNSKNTKTL